MRMTVSMKRRAQALWEGDIKNGNGMEVYPPDIPDDEFIAYVETAKEKCLVSQALAAIDISIEVEQVGDWPY